LAAWSYSRDGWRAVGVIFLAVAGGILLLGQHRAERLCCNHWPFIYYWLNLHCIHGLTLSSRCWTAGGRRRAQSNNAHLLKTPSAKSYLDQSKMRKNAEGHLTQTFS